MIIEAPSEEKGRPLPSYTNKISGRYGEAQQWRVGLTGEPHTDQVRPPSFA